jgi:hypothetical protein
MALADMLLAAAQSWPRLSLELGDEQLAVLRRHLAAAVHGAEWNPALVVEALTAGRDRGDVLWRALIERPTRTTAYLEEPATYPAPGVPWAALELRLAIERNAPAAAPNPDAVDDDAESRVFSVPMYEVEHAEGPLLVLEREGHEYAPAFQFDPEGRVLAAAAIVNEILDARDDPWGAASWWLTPHATLGGIPADLVRVGDPNDVVTAATAAGA